MAVVTSLGDGVVRGPKNRNGICSLITNLFEDYSVRYPTFFIEIGTTYLRVDMFPNQDHR